MEIIFENSDGLVIDTFHKMTFVSCKVGDKINISVENHAKHIWDIKEYSGEFEVLSIDNVFRKTYPAISDIDYVSSNNFVTVVVEPII